MSEPGLLSQKYSKLFQNAGVEPSAATAALLHVSHNPGCWLRIGDATAVDHAHEPPPPSQGRRWNYTHRTAQSRRAENVAGLPIYFAAPASPGALASPIFLRITSHALCFACPASRARGRRNWLLAVCGLDPHRAAAFRPTGCRQEQPRHSAVPLGARARPPRQL